MTLKWLAVVVAAVSLTLFVTMNVVAGTVRDGGPAPLLVNVLALTVAGTATVLAVVAGLHERLDTRITALTDFLVARLDELDRKADDPNTAFVEGYLLSRAQESGVVPIGSRTRGRRTMIGGED
jgi:hypothetical protein